MRTPPPWYRIAEKLRRENRTLQEISDLLGVAVPTIRTQLAIRMKDYESFKQPTVRPELTARSKRIRQSLREGEHPPDIAKREGVSRQYVYKVRAQREESVDKHVDQEVKRVLLERKFENM
jgi:DNA-binding CsgD family transcriptional regulator|tara:strand:- start:230 stop:592 length:363 start_codon:yes stop_codon:yes gene_type:complete